MLDNIVISTIRNRCHSLLFSAIQFKYERERELKCIDVCTRFVIDLSACLPALLVFVFSYFMNTWIYVNMFLYVHG